MSPTASSWRLLTSGAAARPTAEAPGLKGTAGKGWAEGRGLFGAVGWNGAPEPRAAPMHTLILTRAAHTRPTSAHTPCTNIHIHAHTNALRCTLTRAHRHTRTRVHTHWDTHECSQTHTHACTQAHTHMRAHTPGRQLSPPRRLRGLPGNKSHVPTREKDALPTGAPDSPLIPSPPGRPGARLLPGAQEGCPRAAFSLEEPAPPGGFHPPSTGHHMHGRPRALGEARLCPRPHSKGSQGRVPHPCQTHGRRAEPTMYM